MQSTTTCEFNPQALANGDMSQLQNFVMSDGPKSLYIEWVPNDFTMEIAMDHFGFYGSIHAIDFVKKRNGTDRMAFVHYYEFNNKIETLCLIQTIAQNYPNAFEKQLYLYDKEGNNYVFNNYILRYRINLTPISRVEYNNAQLTDMVDRLRKELEEVKLQLAEMKR
jgi:hypothetical protein